MSRRFCGCVVALDVSGGLANEMPAFEERLACRRQAWSYVRGKIWSSSDAVAPSATSCMWTAIFRHTLKKVRLRRLPAHPILAIWHFIQFSCHLTKVPHRLRSELTTMDFPDCLNCRAGSSSKRGEV